MQIKIDIFSEQSTDFQTLHTLKEIIQWTLVYRFFN